jgi:diketogulonate reductase-like aldo/keto reductase
MKTITLNNGIEMPLVGLGTARLEKGKMGEIIAAAYQIGYRNFDTALTYGNEREIAYALRENNINRGDVFLTTKLNSRSLYIFNEYYYGKKRFLNIRNMRSIHSVIQESFDNLGTDYIDLFMVHWPYPNYLKLYKALAEQYKQGRIRAIGVCNFTPEHIESLAEVTDIIPAVCQTEISPFHTNKRLISYCHQKGIAVEAMAVFTKSRSSSKNNELFDNTVLGSIASKHKKSVVQVVLRWLNQQNIIVIPRTSSIGHLRDNFDIFDFELSREEIAAIDALDRGECIGYNPNLPHIIRSIPQKYRQ